MKTKHFKSRHALLMSLTSLMLCVSMLFGATFAWFTDSVTSGVNRIVSGNLDVELLHVNADTADNATDADKTVAGNTLLFNAAADKGTILWEPGAASYETFTIQNKGTLNLKYEFHVNNVGNNTMANDTSKSLLNALRVAVVEGAYSAEAKSAINTESKTLGDLIAGTDTAFSVFKGNLNVNDTPSVTEKTFTVILYWPQSDADNQWNPATTGTNTYATSDGKQLYVDLGITLVATQETGESDSFDNTYDADAGKDTAFYTLAEFNALTEIPEGVKVAYVNLNGASLEGGLTIGNANIADHYAYTDWNSDVAPAGYPTKVGTDKRASDGATRYIYSTGKPAADVILIGSVTGAKDTGGFNAGSITLKVPDAANVIFEKVNFGAGQMAMSMWTEPNVASMTVPHRVASVTFDSCTFNGNWIQNGAFGADEMVVKNCTFNVHENTGYKNNSNPIWIQNLGRCNVTIEGCTINAVRPIKLWEGTASGSVTIKNNTFNMSNFVDATGGDAYKNVAVMFCGTTEQVKLGNVEITGNTVTGSATGFVCFYDSSTQHPSMADGATFKLSGNTLNGAKESVIWKTNTEWKPSYVNQ